MGIPYIRTQNYFTSQMKILLLEDDPVYLQILEIYCKKMGTAYPFHHYRELKTVLPNLKPDIIVADVFVEKESSIDFFKHEENQIAPILFISNSESIESIRESLTVPFSLFLKKPIEPISLEIHIAYLIREFKKYHQTNKAKFPEGIIVKGKFNQDILVPYSDILYVESDRNYITLFLTTGKVITHKQSLNKFIEECPPNYIRIAKSIIVNVLATSKWRANPHFFYFENKIFPIGKSYQEEVRSQLHSMYLPFKYDDN